MAVKFLDRVWQETATTGTGTITLGAALPGFLTAAEAGATDADEVEFVIRDGDDFELSRGVVGDSGTTLTRETVIRSKVSGVAGTSKLNLSGAAQVMVVASAGEMLGRGGGTMTGPLVLPASTAAAPSLHIEPGIDPTAPVNGNVWINSAGDGVLRLRRDGASVSLWDSSALELISKADAEAGTSTIGRIWSAERVAQAIAALTPPGLGVGQTWQNVLGSRVVGTAYQNTTGRPIEIAILSGGSESLGIEVSSDGSTWIMVTRLQGTYNHTSFIIPAGWYYKARGNLANGSWAELR